MLFEIKNRFTGAVLFSLECGSFRLCVEAAVSAGADLAGAYLAGANLARADLAGANLARANLAGAYLAGAYLAGADLARADLAGANLARADLARADLAGANLAGAQTDAPVATPEQAVANLDRVREIILDDQKRLEMGHWHANDEWTNRTCAEEAVCGTTHCLAGWLQVCSTHPKMRALSPEIAGVLLAPVASRMFYRENDETLKWLADREYAAEAMRREG